MKRYQYFLFLLVFALLGSGLVVSFLFREDEFSSVSDTYGVEEKIISSFGDKQFNNTEYLGYELLDNNSVLHIWNIQDSYYFNTSSGIQFSNHYEEYWTRNVLMLGYYDGDKWNIIYRTDELSGFNKDITGITNESINATIWKDLSYGDYDFRLAIRYCLNVNDSDLTVIPYIKNLGIAIPFTLGFGWELKDIQIKGTPENDYIKINKTSYYLNQTLDEKYTNLSFPLYNATNSTIGWTNPVFNLIENETTGSTKYLYLTWDKDLDYLVWVKNRAGQYNAPVTLFIRVGTLAVDQEKYTEMHWYDSESIYYFDSWDEGGEEWDGDPNWMVDGELDSFAWIVEPARVQLLNSNTYTTGGSGDILGVLIRAYGFILETKDPQDVKLRPVFGGEADGDDHIFNLPLEEGDWSSWYDITTDTNHPDPWTWIDVAYLDCDVESAMTEGTEYCAKIELKVICGVASSRYFFNSYSEEERWTFSPEQMVDNNTANYASTSEQGDIELCDGNTCDGTDLGTISKVELRAYCKRSNTADIYLRPVFGGKTDGDNHELDIGTSGAWSVWHDITTDRNAPPSWIWADVQTLDCDVDAFVVGVMSSAFCSKVEIRVTYTPLDTDPPIIDLNFAGNPHDDGGPYVIPPGEMSFPENLADDGYYTNDSRQSEGWINISANIIDATDVGNVWLNWLNETTWTNWTYKFVDGAGDLYWINTSQNFSTASGYNYSFNIVANDTASPINSNVTWWNKTGIGGGWTRRYVQLNCTPQSIEYTPFYCYDAAYPGIFKLDRLHHDQGQDGSIYDTGYLLDDVPTGTVSLRKCDSFTGYWFDESVCIQDMTLDNFYVHTWWASDTNKLKIYWEKNRRYLGLGDDYDEFITSASLAVSNITYDNSDPGYSNSYHLCSRYLDATDIDFGDNDIYEFSIIYRQTSEHPSTISNRSFTSFVLFNVPDNATLNASHADTDSDGLSDWTELYVTHTNPFLSDTDNDKVSDYGEYMSGSDPNNYTDTIEFHVWQNIFNSYHTFGNISINNLVFFSWHAFGNISNNKLQLDSYHTFGNLSTNKQQLISWHTFGNITTSELEFESWHTFGNITERTWENAITSYHTFGNVSNNDLNLISYHNFGNISGNKLHFSSWHTLGSISGPELEFTSYHIFGNISDNKLQFSSWHTFGNVSEKEWIITFTSWHSLGNISDDELQIMSWHTFGNIINPELQFTSYHTFGNISTTKIVFTAWHTFGNIANNELVFTAWHTFGNITIGNWEIALTSYHTFGNISDDKLQFSSYHTFGNVSVGNLDFNSYHTFGNIIEREWILIFTSYHTLENVSNNELQIDSYHTFGNISVKNLEFTSYHIFGNVSNDELQFISYHTCGNKSAGKLQLSSWHTFGNITFRSWQNIFTSYHTFGHERSLTNIFISWHTFGNVTTYDQVLIFNSWHTFGNISVDLFIDNIYPPNATNIFRTQPTIFFNLTSPTGSPINYSIYYGKNNESCNILLDSDIDVGNGTYHYEYYAATNFSIAYCWRVVANDATSNIDKWFYFTSVREGEIVGGMSLAFPLIGLFAIPFAMLALIKRKKKNVEKKEKEWTY